jgi:hypothetical protein
VGVSPEWDARTRLAVEKVRPRRVETLARARVHALARRLPPEVLDDSSLVIGERYGVRYSTVLRLLHERGVAVRIGKVSQEDVAEISALYAAGDTQQTIADRFGVIRAAVRYVLLKQGVRLRART